MLRAARSRFLAESYDNVGLREIAREAGVDVALVGRYFGSKEELFRETLRDGKDGPLDPEVSVDSLPAYLADLLMQSDHGGAQVDRLLMILRSASSPKAAAIVREALTTDVLEPVGRLLGGPDAEMRASMALGILMGATVLRTIMAVEPLCECDRGLVRQKLIRLLAAALAEEPGGSG
jgi:AcrR family transcriptional regulator